MTPEHLLLRRILNRLASLLVIAQGVPSEYPECFRAAGDCRCPDCGYLYRQHMQSPFETYLRVLCNGEHVKL